MSMKKGLWRHVVLGAAVGALGLLGTARADVVADQAPEAVSVSSYEVDVILNPTVSDFPKVSFSIKPAALLEVDKLLRSAAGLNIDMIS